jgi:hypothetical protein
MDRYLVESPHSEQDCQKALTQVLALGFISHYDWGCKSGVHKGWAIVESDSETEALLTVPTFIRHDAKATKLNRYTPDDFEKSHGIQNK